TYLVDGYNVILTTRFKEMDMERAREYLVSFSRVFAPAEVIVVFDGREGIFQHLPGAVFTKGESADEYIRRWLRKCPNPREVIVVTEDREIRGTAGALGARVMSAREFVRGPRRLTSKKEGGGCRPTSKEAADINRELMDEWEIT
ncbi:MAG: NYN domain-containing protein, partial [Candidatus Hydrothermia bacterium]